ncbi:hypothetical protein P5673_025421 [Acropora cervicornis]|uniref:Uncharacterized protein n=1 Tax=Acropora cervicornis TaxID=6130 RepID=A0AAD9Q286_ACRCE|nr:hypothetical protein P5673_025421 [Acropora cervicornis]
MRLPRSGHEKDLLSHVDGIGFEERLPHTLPSIWKWHKRGIPHPLLEKKLKKRGTWLTSLSLFASTMKLCEKRIISYLSAKPTWSAQHELVKLFAAKWSNYLTNWVRMVGERISCDNSPCTEHTKVAVVHSGSRARGSVNHARVAKKSGQ